jgi:hypothetical protein
MKLDFSIVLTSNKLPMKKLMTIFSAILINLNLTAQVPKTIVVEHFTNSRCSVCASRNPGFYTNLNQQQNAIHLAIHPSSPYSTCVFSQANVTENDGRTNYYGIFGSTPRLVIQGQAISASTNYSNQALFDPFINQTSPASITLTQTNNGSEIQLRVCIKTEAPNSLGNLKLYAALKENQVDYAAPNGENVHYDVFRKSFFSNDGMPVTLAAAGDSIILEGTLPLNTAWDQSQLSAIVILQEEGNKSVVQAAEQNTPAAVLTINSPKNGFSIHPNPASDFVTIKSSENTKGFYQIFNAIGAKMMEDSFLGTETIHLKNLPSGVYFIQLNNGSLNFVERILIQH